MADFYRRRPSQFMMEELVATALRCMTGKRIEPVVEADLNRFMTRDEIIALAKDIANNMVKTNG